MHVVVEDADTIVFKTLNVKANYLLFNRYILKLHLLVKKYK